ncbi:MAG: hypothetical protein AAF264_11140 [Pseudomonadota bacterium]
MWQFEENDVYPTAYAQERAQFAALKRDLQRRKRAGWRRRLGLLVAGRRVRPLVRDRPVRRGRMA